jgi:hypothetical protein
MKQQQIPDITILKEQKICREGMGSSTEKHNSEAREGTRLL